MKGLGSKDPGLLTSLLHPDVDFRALTPGRFWECDTADAVVNDVFLGTWFGPDAEIVEVTVTDTAAIGTRRRVGYRFRVVKPEGGFAVEQQAFLDHDGDRITWLRILCSGFQPEN